MMDELDTVLYGDIVKVDDEKHTVEGYISADGIDIGGQIVDQGWLRKTLPAWVADWGNVREMHGLSAVGTVNEYSDLGDKPWVSAQIVDDAAWKKVKAGVYKGFSVGIKNAVVVRDEKAPRGRIVGGDMFELSLVDRPAHPDARITLFKVASNGTIHDMQHSTVLEPNLPPEPSDDAYITAKTPEDLTRVTGEQKQVWNAIKSEYSGTASHENTATTQNFNQFKISNLLPYLYGPKPVARLKAALEIYEMGIPLPGDIAKTVASTLNIDADLIKRDYTTEEREKYAKEGIALPDGSFPIPDAAALEDAARRLHQASDVPAVRAHIRKRAKELGVEMPDVVKAAKIVHPYSGSHPHAHSHPGFAPGYTHTHLHNHNEDDIHDHAHESAEADLAAPEPDDTVMKAAADFGYTTPAALPTLQKLEGSLNTLMKEVRSTIESLANQTDKDRDGDVDTPANMGPMGTGGTRGPVKEPQFAAPAPINPETLALGFTSRADASSMMPDLAKSLDALVQKRVSEALALYSPPVSDVGSMTADIAKVAGALAQEVSRLAGGVGAVAEEQNKLRAQQQELISRQAKVETLAQPVKGQTVVAAEKTIGLADGKEKPQTLSMDDFIKKARSATPADRDEAVRTMIQAIHADRALGR